MIEIFYSVVLALTLIAILFCIYMQFRISKVYRYRDDMIDADTERYGTLPSFNRMLHNHIFTWDMDKVVEKLEGSNNGNL